MCQRKWWLRVWCAAGHRGKCWRRWLVRWTSLLRWPWSTPPVTKPLRLSTLWTSSTVNQVGLSAFHMLHISLCSRIKRSHTNCWLKGIFFLYSLLNFNFILLLLSFFLWDCKCVFMTLHNLIWFSYFIPTMQVTQLIRRHFKNLLHNCCQFLSHIRVRKTSQREDKERDWSLQSHIQYH